MGALLHLSSADCHHALSPITLSHVSLDLTSIPILKAPLFSFIFKFVNLIGKKNGLLNLYFFITN